MILESGALGLNIGLRIGKSGLKLLEGRVASLGKLLLELVSVGGIVEFGDPCESLPEPLVCIVNRFLDGGLEGLKLTARPFYESSVP